MIDGFKVTILEDGRIKVESGSFSGPLHTTAERFLADVIRLAGGSADKGKGGHYHHDHEHAHGEGHVHA